MTHDNKAPGEPGSEPVVQPAPVESKPFVYPDTPGEAAGAGVEGLAEMMALKAEVAELKDRVLRTHAEMDNMRKRLEKEKSDAGKYAISKFARDIVGVGDNFQRAISTVPPGAVESLPALQSFLDGVSMTERELLNVLERHGIKRIDPKGQLFNPHHHQAVMEQPNPEVPAGTVTQVFQLGYMIEDRVLRPAMVVVATGGAKPAKAPEAPGPDGNGGAGGATQ